MAKSGLGLLLAAGVALALVSGLWGWGKRGSGPSAPPTAAGAAFEFEASPQPEPADGPAGSLPASLRGTTRDGAYTLDADGHFLPSPAVLRRFDWFLSVSGEEPLPVTRVRIEADIAAELAPDAAADAQGLLERYLAYRDAARSLHAEGLEDADLDVRLQRIRELRRAHFGTETSRLLFGEEEALALDALERRRITNDPDLDDAERARRLEALDTALPEAAARVRREAMLPARLARRETLLREEGGDAGDLRRLREDEVGVEAADRLEALDARRAAWRRRVDAYRLQRDALLADPEMGAAELESLRAEHFAPQERARVRGLDRIDGVDLASDDARGSG